MNFILLLLIFSRKQHPNSTEALPLLTTNLPDFKADHDSNNAKILITEENKTEIATTVQPKSSENNVKTSSNSNLENDNSKLLKFAGSSQQENHTVQNSSAKNESTGLLMHLNSTPSQSATLVQEENLENSDSKILLKVEHTSVQNQPIILNSGTNNSNSKIIVQLDSAQQPQPSIQTSHSNNPSDSNSNRIVVQLDPSQTQNSQTALIQSSSASSSNSRILLQLGQGQQQSLPPNTVFTVGDAIHLAPLVEDVNSINLGNVTTQFIQLATNQPEEPLTSNSTVVNGNNIPLHIQLPVSSVQVPISTISHGSGSGAYELKALSIQGQTGLVFASTGFDIGNITY